MAAAALVELRGGTAEQCAEAFAMAPVSYTHLAVLCFTFNAVAGVRIALRNTNTQKRSAVSYTHLWSAAGRRHSPIPEFCESLAG